MSMGESAPSSGYGTGPGVVNADPEGTLVKAQENTSALLAEPSKVTEVLILPATFGTTRRGRSGPISAITVCELIKLAAIAASTTTVCELITDWDVLISVMPVIADICD